jgi:hypothetical protein
VSDGRHTCFPPERFAVFSNEADRSLGHADEIDGARILLRHRRSIPDVPRRWIVDDRRHGSRALFVWIVSVLVVFGATPAALADTPEVLWTWTFTPSPSWDNVMCVRGGPDLDGDGYADALVASEDRFLRALSGHSTDPPAEIWAFGGTLEVPVNEDAIAFYPDRDGDGKPEILLTTGYADRSVRLIRSFDGEPYWEFTVADSGCTESAWFWDAVPLEDVDGDGVTDVVAAIGAACSRVLALSGDDGSVIWQYLAADGCRAVVDVGDLTGDGFHDVLATSGSNFEDNRLFLLRGNPGATTRLVWQHYATSFVDAATMVQDFTGDGVSEAIGGSWDSTVFAVSGASVGTVTVPLWEISVSGGTGWVQDTITIPDVDGDCIDDIAVASWTPTTRVVSGRTGDTLWSQPVGTASHAAYGAIVPDLTGDLQWDYVAGSLNTGFVSLYSGADGVPIWEWQAPGNVRSVSWIDDIDDDGLPDILAGLQDVASAVALSGRTSPFCVRPVSEVAELRASRLDAGRIHMTWATSADSCHASYRVYGVRGGVHGIGDCFANLIDITDQDEDGDFSNESWTGPAQFFGYLVVDETANGGKGPLGHFRR